MDVVSNVHVERRADNLILDFSTAPDNQNRDLELGVVQRCASGLGAVKSQLQQVRAEIGPKAITKVTEKWAVTEGFSRFPVRRFPLSAVVKLQ